jgi:glycerate 2-kinase
VRVVAAPDKLRGTLTALQACRAIADAATAHGASCDVVPMADGGEGTLDALAAIGGRWCSAAARDPLGRTITTRYLRRGSTAFVEMARASGLEIVGGAAGNDPMAASTAGTGDVVRAAIADGARRIVVTLGGSATTDGGLGFLDALAPLSRWKGIEFVAATDVRTVFADAADVFAPQKGATPTQVKMLRGRLVRLAQQYAVDLGVDVTTVPGSGAAGGLGGALVAIGAQIVSGFDLVAEEADLREIASRADLLITAEGFVDDGSFEGKVVGGVCRIGAELGVPVLAVGGQVLDGLGEPGAVSGRMGGHVTVASLVGSVGLDRALGDTAAALTEVVGLHLASLPR